MMSITVQQASQVGLGIACTALAFYCIVIGRRLSRLNDLESGLGGAIAIMAAEVSRLESALAHTRTEATSAGAQLATAIENARNERALWTIQSRFTVEDPSPRPRRRRRAEIAAEASDAQA